MGAGRGQSRLGYFGAGAAFESWREAAAGVSDRRRENRFSIKRTRFSLLAAISASGDSAGLAFDALGGRDFAGTVAYGRGGQAGSL